MKRVQQFLDVKCAGVSIFRNGKKQSWIYFLKDRFSDDMVMMNVLFINLTSIPGVIFVAKVVSRISRAASEEIIITSKEASMVVITPIC